MSAATILFTDIVSFSKKPTAEQRRLVESLTSEVVHELRTLLIPPLDTPSIIALPTGDGLALAFLHRTNHPWSHTTILHLILRMHQWANNQSSPHNLVSIRVGVHVGAVELVTDINGKANLCGDTINYGQRVMDAANPRQTLYSEAAFREYVGSESPSCNTPLFSEDVKVDFLGPIEVYAKHGLQILVYKLSLEPSQPYWTNDDPIAKQLMLTTLTPLPKEVVGSFSEQIHKGTNIAFIQLTGDRFISKFNEGEIEFSKQLKRFWVFMPAPDVYANLHLTKPQATPQLVKDCVQKWKDLFAKLKTQFTDADFKLGLFKEPPYFGASYIDWERPDGKIHISPYVWNVAAPNCPGYDIYWIGKKPSAIYETYVEGLQYLYQSTENELTK
ncbi:MAG: adenylate/guanylate cyclase domain-containing protein [Candidatus Omnitrophota bacterium]